jgi:hypothetical protein
MYGCKLFVLIVCLLAAFNGGQAAGAAGAQRAQKPLGERAYEKALWALEHASHVKYEHNNKRPADQVEESMRNGEVSVQTDCSGFASWVLHNVSPDRLWAVEALQPGHECPQAKTFARFFASLPTDKPFSGWIGVPAVSDLKRGDFIAWSDGKGDGERGNTGHVMIVAERPGPPEQTVVDGKTLTYVSIRVIDSSSVVHFAPETLPPFAGLKHRDGLGEGYVRLVLDGDGRPVERWEGTYSEGKRRDITHPSPSPIISFGRVVGKENWPKIKNADIQFEKKVKDDWVRAIE